MIQKHLILSVRIALANEVDYYFEILWQNEGKLWGEATPMVDGYAHVLTAT